MRLCSGCRTKVEDSVRFCVDCTAERSASVDDGIRHNTVSDRDRYQFLYSGKRWQRVQAIALRRCPFCARCGQAVSVLVDHIVPAGVAIAQAQESGLWRFDKYAGFYLLSNLQGLCRSCHWTKTLEDKTHSGPWPSVVEAERAAPKRKVTFF